MRGVRLGLTLVFVSTLFVACGGDDGEEDGSGGSAGTGGTTAINIGGSAGKSTGTSGSSTGGSSTGGEPSGTSGTTATGAGGDSSGAALGGVCALSENCSQAQGAAVCCEAEGCAGPCMCVLAEDCSMNGSYLPCEAEADCEPFGGGRVCCVAGDMHYCTKPSGCAGDTLP
jgi:hypothetical protein